MSYVQINWICDNCGAQCSDIRCIMCGRELKDYREKLLEAEQTDRAIRSIKKVIERCGDSKRTI